MPPLEQHNSSDTGQRTQQPEHAIQSTVQETWGPQTYFKLGATLNDTYNQSLSTQYDDVGAKALNAAGRNVMQLFGTLEFVVTKVGADALSVAADDLQIGYEKLTNPPLAEVNTARLSEKLHQLGSKYEPALRPMLQAHAVFEHDLEFIGFHAEKDPHQYERLITDPSKTISGAIDKFTAQTPGDQVGAIIDQSMQFAEAGMLGKLAGVARGALRIDELAAKFDGLLSKMDSDIARLKNPLESQAGYASATGDNNLIKTDSYFMSKAEELNSGNKPASDRPAVRAKEVVGEVNKLAYEAPSEMVVERIAELTAALPENVRGRITLAIAVVEDAQGTRSVLLGTSEKYGYLRGIEPQAGETVIAGPKQHAEIDLLDYAKMKNLKVIDIGATRPICEDCAGRIKETEAHISTPLKDAKKQ